MRDLVIPKKIKFEKSRFGRNCDGGYIFAKTPLRNQKVFGFGVSNDISCESDLFNYFKTSVNLFDGTCDFPGVLPENFTYNKENISGENINRILKIDNPIILKMDIEGYEFPSLLSIEDSVLENIEQMVVEFHLAPDIAPIANCNSLDELLDKFFEIIKKIQKTHKIFHIHGNNFVGLLSNSIPIVVELSFINKKICDIDEIDDGNYPDPNLDYRNTDFNPELVFKWW